VGSSPPALIFFVVVSDYFWLIFLAIRLLYVDVGAGGAASPGHFSSAARLIVILINHKPGEKTWAIRVQNGWEGRKTSPCL
jgi:hypothetical protein